jgi:hypothetical protein
MLRPMSRLLCIVLASSLVAACGGDDDGIEVVPVPVQWNYMDAVTLTAENFTLRLLESSSPVLRSNADAIVTGSGFTVGHDAGTLEVEWMEAGNTMRVLFFFTKDVGNSRWHLSTIQHFDGKFPQGWVFYTGPFWDSALGAPYTEDTDLSPDDGQPGAELRLQGLTVNAFLRELPEV